MFKIYLITCLLAMHPNSTRANGLAYTRRSIRHFTSMHLFGNL